MMCTELSEIGRLSDELIMIRKDVTVRVLSQDSLLETEENYVMPQLRTLVIGFRYETSIPLV